jgi:hypothetical protein
MMKRTLRRNLIPVALAMALMAAFPGVAAADVFLEEGFETIPEETVPTGKSVLAADEFPTAISGERLEVFGNQGELTVLDLGTGVVSCDAVDLDGGTLTEAAPQVQLAADYTDCEYHAAEGGGEGSTAPVTMNSCKYVLSDFAPLTGTASDAAGEIDCDQGDKIEIDFNETCSVTIPAQSLQSRSELGNLSSGLAAEIYSSEVTYTVVGYEYLCHTTGGLPTVGTHEDGTVRSQVELHGS